MTTGTGSAGARSDLRSGSPVGWRLVLAFALAPLVPAAMFAATTLWDGVQNGSYLQLLLTIAILGAYPPAFVLGLPAFLVLRLWVKPGLVPIALVGGLVAALPWLLLGLFASNPDYASIGQHVTVRDGRTTLWGYVALLKVVGMTFALGTIGGAAFWAIALGRVRPGSWGQRSARS